MVAKMKKMNKMLVLPLFLGAVVLGSAGIITGIHALTEPFIQRNIIAKENAGYMKILGITTVDEVVEHEVSEALVTGGVKSKKEFKLSSGTSVGVVYDVEITGYTSGLKFQVGFNEGNYAGFNVVSSGETPAYGGVLLEEVNAAIKGKSASENAPIASALMAGKSITGKALNTALGLCADDYMKGVN